MGVIGGAGRGRGGAQPLGSVSAVTLA
jgi:hypothetical protein